MSAKEVNLNHILRFKSGRNGVDEIKAHPWFADLNWETLRTVPAPYIPEGSSRMKSLLVELRLVHEYSFVVICLRFFNSII